MNITTKYNVGDKVFTLDTKTLKVKQIEIDRIITLSKEGGETSVSLYDKEDDYCNNSYDESKCFPTEAELITFITTKS